LRHPEFWVQVWLGRAQRSDWLAEHANSRTNWQASGADQPQGS